MNSEQITAFFARALVHCFGAHRSRDFNWGDPQLELALRPPLVRGMPTATAEDTGVWFSSCWAFF